jgi:hypothetical protein
VTEKIIFTARKRIKIDRNRKSNLLFSPEVAYFSKELEIKSVL